MSGAVLGQGQRVVEAALLGAERHRLASVLQRLAPLLSAAIGFLDQCPGEAIVGIGVVGLEPDGGAVFDDRLIPLPLQLEDFAEADVGIDEVGLEPAGGAVLGDRLIQLPLLLKGQAEVVVDKWRSRAGVEWPRGIRRPPRRSPA